MSEGTISAVRADRGFGFIKSPNQPDIFFHMSDLGEGLEFDASLQELRVRFDIAESSRGPRAANVRPAE